MSAVVDYKDGEVSRSLEQASDALPASGDGAMKTSPPSPSVPPSPSFPSSPPSPSSALAAGLAAFRAARAAWLVLPDAETLHDARVALRRLRTALELYGGIVRLPREVTVRRVRRLSRRLAPLRDLDVAAQQLPSLPSLVVEVGLDRRVERARARCRAKVASALRGRNTRRWQKALAGWLRAVGPTKPAPSDARAPIAVRLAQLWPPLSVLPGWTVEIPNLARASDEALEALHLLRRRLRVSRYLVELGAIAGSDRTHPSPEDLQQLQTSLGALQDIRVLRDILRRGADPPEWANLAPALLPVLEAAWAERWRQWTELRSSVGGRVKSGPVKTAGTVTMDE